MKKIILLFMIISFIINIYPLDKIKILNINSPRQIYAHENVLYIVDGLNIIHIYSLEENMIKSTFGKLGKGPGEFKNRITQLSFLNKTTLVESTGKISYFTQSGDFIKDQSIQGVWKLYPEKDKFIGQSLLKEEQTNYILISTYNQKYEKINEICKFEDSYQVNHGKGINVFKRTTSFGICNGKLVIASDEDFVIQILNLSGEKFKTINEQYVRFPVLLEHKEIYFDDLKNNPDIKSIPIGWLKKNIIFSSHFPAIKDIFLDQSLIYVQTYKRDKDSAEFLIYNSEGGFVKNIFIPLLYSSTLKSYPFVIHKGNLHQLFETESKDNKWVLSTTRITEIN